jgi:hypothetical protein
MRKRVLEAAEELVEWASYGMNYRELTKVSNGMGI